jgi:hypothetical protein
MNLIKDNLRSESLGVSEHPGHQVGAGQAMGIARPIVDIRGGHQLAALLYPGDQHRTQVGASSIHSSGITCRTRPENEQWAVAVRTHQVLQFERLQALFSQEALWESIIVRKSEGAGIRNRSGLDIMWHAFTRAYMI